MKALMKLMMLGGMLIFSFSRASENDSGSLFTASLQWKNEQGKKVSLEDFKKQWTVISMMYTSCRSSCPMIVKKMRQIETRLASKGKKAQFVLVSFDPERDTPEKLKTYREKISATESHWHFWTGASADVRKLSMLLGIKFAQDPESKEFMHDNKIVLLSPEGKLKARIENLGDSESELVEAIEKK